MAAAFDGVSRSGASPRTPASHHILRRPDGVFITELLEKPIPSRTGRNGQGENARCIVIALCSTLPANDENAANEWNPRPGTTNMPDVRDTREKGARAP